MCVVCDCELKVVLVVCCVLLLFTVVVVVDVSLFVECLLFVVGWLLFLGR